MCIFFYFLHDVFFKIIVINMPYSVMVSPYSAGISQSCIQVNCVPV